MRLLIAMDTVRDFPEALRRNPTRFDIAASDLAETVEAVRARQGEELARRRFSYTRSDARSVELSLADVMARARGFEMSYNPNVCVEIGWGAPEGGDEMSSCQRHAPTGQQGLMREYREWFATRRRPIW
jgi:hypothetical protein